MTDHRDSDVLGRYVGAPAAPVQGEEMEAGEHTPTPWSFDGNCGGYISQAGDRIARAYAHKDAAFIVTAVNNHAAIMAENKTAYQRIDELETALKRVIILCETPGSRVEGSGYHSDLVRGQILEVAQNAVTPPFPAESGAYTA